MPVKGFRSPVPTPPPEKSVEAPDGAVSQADGDSGQSRCTICDQPFIYGWGEPDDSQFGFKPGTFRKNTDDGVQTDNGDWVHTSCKEGI